MIEDLSAFAADFGTPATWSVGPKAVLGIFDAGYQAAELGLQVGIDGARYTYLVPAADVPGVAQDQTLTINGTVYTIRRVEPDGTGMVLLLLKAP